MAIEKIKILGAILELPALSIWPIWPNFEVNGLDWKYCLVGSSKTVSQDFHFFNCPGCRIFILCEIYCYLCPHIFWVYYFSLSQWSFYCLSFKEQNYGNMAPKNFKVSVQNVNLNARQFFLSLELKSSANFPKGNVEKKSHVIR